MDNVQCKKKGESEANWNIVHVGNYKNYFKSEANYNTNSREPPKKSTMKKKLIYNNENDKHNIYNKTI